MKHRFPVILRLCHVIVQNFEGLVATRFFLGLAEAGIFPGRDALECIYPSSMLTDQRVASTY